MNQKKSVFSLLGGIFMMCAGFFSVVLSMINLIRASQFSAVSFGSVIGLILNILILLCGLFLLLRKPRVAAIMMCCVAGLFVLNVVLNLTINSATYNWFTTVCYFFAYGLFAAGLFGKGVYALIMCLGAAFFRFMPFIVQLTRFSSSIRFGGLSILNSSVSLLSAMLTIAAMVMAALYLFKQDRVAPARPPYQY